MRQIGYQKVLELLLVFSLLLLSNLSAFVYTIWLSPKLVLAETIMGLLFMFLVILALHKNNKLYFFFDLLIRNWYILPFLAYCGFSIIWSINRDISLYRWLFLVFTIFAGGYIGLCYGLRRVVGLLAIFGVCVLLLSTALVFFAPHIGVMNYHSIQGAWKGLYWHKNHLGLIAAFVNLLLLINIVDHIRAGNGTRILFWSPVFYLFSLTIVYQSDSVAAYFTSILLHGFTLVAALFLKFKDKLRKIHYLLLVAAFGLAVFVALLNVDLIFGVFNRNTTLTGRVPMWSYLFRIYFGERPFWGYGFNAFWYDESHRIVLHELARYPDQIVIADNGFIDLLVNVGFSGMSLFLVFFAGILWRSIKFASTAVDIISMFPLVLMCFVILANLSWSLIFENESFFMLIMISVLFCVAGKDAAGEVRRDKYYKALS